MHPIDPTLQYLTCCEVAKILRCKRETVQEYCRTGSLPAKKVGRSWLITRAAVATFMAAR